MRYITMGRLDTALQYCKDNTRWYVYLISDDSGRPVYVGSTAYPEKRYAAHLDYRQIHQGRLREWLAIHPHSFEVLDNYPTRRMMLDAEHEYIAYLAPALNVAR